MRKIAFVAIALLFTATASAVQAYKQWKTFTQSDGSTITLMLVGDEYSHYYVTEDGTKMRRLANGDFEQMGTEEITQAKTKRAAKLSNIKGKRKVNQAISQSKTRNSSYSGTLKGLVIMMQFTDKEFRDEYAFDDWNALLNKTGYSSTEVPGGTPSSGSVSDYFADQSDGNFSIEFDLYGPFTAENSYEYYGQNDEKDEDNIDINMCYLVAEACDAVKDQVDFSDYDWDSDGEVDQVFILYAGEGENVVGNSSDLIWPHEYWLQYYSAYRQTGGYEVEDGILINQYACGAEILYNNMLSGLGTFCHEFSHCLGLPDFYTYEGTDTFGEFDIMDEGNYNGYGWCPPNYTAYERAYCGWHTPTELEEAATITDLETVANGGLSYLVRNDALDETVDEYYLLENRQQEGWDTEIPSEGLIITHYDYDEQAWASNVINDDADHPRAAIIPANNDVNTPKGFAYPYTKAILYGKWHGNDSLTNYSEPAAIVYNQPAKDLYSMAKAVTTSTTYYMSKPITDITDDDGKVGFVFMGGAATGIRKVITDGDEDSLKSLYGEAVDIYDSSGKIRKHVDNFQGTGELQLPEGVYIIGGNKVYITN